MSNHIIAVGLIPDDGAPEVSASAQARGLDTRDRAAHSTDENGALDAPVPDSVRYTPWQLLGRALRPQFKGSHLLAGLLCAVLGFALVVQVRAASGDQLSALRQEDLVRLLDEVTSRSDQLDIEVSRLRATRDELISGTNQAQAAREVARQRSITEGILSGRLPAEGPGIVIDVADPGRALSAADLFNLLEELRNAGAEAVQVNDVRVVTTSSFIDTSNGPALDGRVLGDPMHWLAIGDPATLDRALEIPGGALPKLRGNGASTEVVQEDLVSITATVELTDPIYARPVTE